MLVERQVGDQTFERPISVLELLHTTHLDDPLSCVLLSLGVESLFADAHFAAELGDRHTLLGLPQRVDDLLLRELRFTHCLVLLQGPNRSEILPTFWPVFRGNVEGNVLDQTGLAGAQTDGPFVHWDETD